MFFGKKRIRLNRILICAGFLLCFLVGWSGSFTLGMTSTVYAENSENSGYTNDQLEALAFLNEIRAKVGVHPVVLNKSITQAAVAHATYYNANKERLPGLSAHSEIEGIPGFTGKSVRDRVKAAGWVPDRYGGAYGEVMHYMQKSSLEAVKGWLDTAYHRNIILSPQYNEVGIGLVDGTAVLDLAGGGTSPSISGGISVYPYDSQTDVPVGFYGLEIPNPLDQFGAEYSGYILSATTDDKMTFNQAVIKDELGNEVAFHEELYSNTTLFLYPKTVLKGNHTYTVTMNYQTEKSPETHTKKWSFTTGKGHALIRLLPDLEEITLNEGGHYYLGFRGVYDDGISEALEGGITFVSTTKGLQVSGTGDLTGVKAGDYTIKATADGNSTQIKIKVYPKWKTKTYGTLSMKAPSDISGHPLQASLEWGLRAGIVSPSGDGLLHPDKMVSEAEFLTMLLKTYSINIQAYQPAKSRHWADAAYSIAKERNYPLNGITNIADRNQIITRQQVAEIVSAADSMNVRGSNAITYVLAKDYMQGVTELSIMGFNKNEKITKAEALKILQHLHQTLDELRGCPANETAESSLPDLPPRKIYEKPTDLEDRSLFAEFREDRKLIIEGKFTEFAGQSFVLKVQERGNVSKQIEDVQVTFNDQGQFHVEAGPYAPDALNLNLYTPSTIYFMSVQYNTMNDNQYGDY